MGHASSKLPACAGWLSPGHTRGLIPSRVTGPRSVPARSLSMGRSLLTPVPPLSLGMRRAAAAHSQGVGRRLGQCPGGLCRCRCSGNPSTCISFCTSVAGWSVQDASSERVLAGRGGGRSGQRKRPVATHSPGRAWVWDEGGPRSCPALSLPLTGHCVGVGPIKTGPCQGGSLRLRRFQRAHHTPRSWYSEDFPGRVSGLGVPVSRTPSPGSCPCPLLTGLWPLTVTQLYWPILLARA